MVTDKFGCGVLMLLLYLQKIRAKGVFVPNAFTPNHDGRNEIFRPLVFGQLVKYRFMIFNRWGQKIFETEDSLQGWDGTSEENFREHAFAWMLTYQFVNKKM